jgi:hypothetical protein
MKMRTLRRLRAQAPRHVRRQTSGRNVTNRREFDVSDATIGCDPEPAPPEAVFDRVTGPYGGRYCDEET